LAGVSATELPPCREPRDVEANIKLYLGDRDPTARYFSFDYCYNFFQAHRERGDVAALSSSETMELSCLHLGFYLASWGMMRGSTDLLQRSIKHFEGVIEAIATAPPAIWQIDANDYGDDAWTIIRDFRDRVRIALPNKTSDILITKIMLGVFGCVPAFDTYFKNGSGLSTFGQSALRRVELFYREHAELIERYRVPTLAFAPGGATTRTYTRAKVIDMIFFIEGAAT
jgi:hypothetical protein